METLPERDDALVGRDVAALERALRRDLGRVAPAHDGNGGAALIALCGLPGTGKSHFAAALARRLPCIILTSDRLRKILVARPTYEREEHLRVFAAAHALLESLLGRGYRVIFDATNLTERAREPLREIAGRTGAPLVLVQLDAPPDLVRRRLARRANGQARDSWSDADWRIYCRLYPGQEAIVGPHLYVDTARDIGVMVERVVRALGRAKDGRG